MSLKAQAPPPGVSQRPGPAPWMSLKAQAPPPPADCRSRRGSGGSAGSRRRASSRSGGSQASSSGGKPAARGSAVRVFDDEGKDVTPRPLFHPDPNTSQQGKLWAAAASFGDAGSAFPSSFPLQQPAGGNASLGSFPRTQGSSSISVSNASGTESIPDGTAEPGSHHDTTVGLSDVQMRREEIAEELTKEDLERRVDIYLTETETLWMLEMAPAVVSTESAEAARVLERNKIYVDMCKARPGNDQFVEKTMQTLKGAAKNKEVQCDRIILEDRGMTVTSWDLYDSFHVSEGEGPSKAEGTRAPAGMHKEKGCQSEAILTSENFQRDLFFMERILMENIFQPKLAAYRQLPILTDTSDTEAAVEDAEQEDHEKEEEAEEEEKEEEAEEEEKEEEAEEEQEEEESEEEQEEAFIHPSILAYLNETPEETVLPRLEQLWSYQCDLTEGHSVSSMAWSKANPDLLAVGYGTFDFKEQKEGLACCWSLKNPRWPERVFRCKHGVTALDFSMANPNLLAVGMYNGFVAIYDVQSCKDTVVSDSSDSLSKHTGPVWQLRWVAQDRGTAGDGRKERLISISADGRVTQWFVQKRLDCTDLMKIKRTGSEKRELPSEKEWKSETGISHQAAGMCFAFHPKDTDLYLAGTEEGHIHKCSCSGKEQFLETYRGHNGPVYKVTWHPFSTDMFLSCSADRSIFLWHQETQTPLLTFTSTGAFVLDIMWSPKSAFIFAAANESRVEVWDLSISVFSPPISCSASPRGRFTSVLFATNTDCLLVGDSQGGICVFELQNLPAPSSTVDALPDIISPLVAV
ncbi:dynein axonemal intermediate chain 4 [Apus apus]|uniref:dynein axonemal intermediate chain 4 n=1 Tax=Apus apus TaxID=8895 RepID=UPI0021F90732|nr:dynein axonemal intermediate chain 4 [Apus apus]